MAKGKEFAQAVGSDMKMLEQKVGEFQKAGTLKSYLLAWGDNISAGYNDSVARRNLTVKNGIGIIHLDFKTNANGGNLLVARLPDDAPTYEMMCDVNIVSGGHVWINAGKREIYAAGIKANTRIIVDIVGVVK